MVPSLRAFITLREENGGSLQELSGAVAIVQSLLKTYGNKLALPAVQEVIAKENAEIASLIRVLQSLGKMDTAGLAKLSNMLGNSSQDDAVAVTTSSPQSVAGLVAGATVVQQEKIGLTVQGSNKIYKRTLDRDLHKVLGN